jgi:hypothetical protein
MMRDIQKKVRMYSIWCILITVCYEFLNSFKPLGPIIMSIGFIICAILVYTLISKKLKRERDKLTKRLNLKVSTISKDWDGYVLEQKNFSIKNGWKWMRSKNKKKMKIEMKDILCNDLESIVKWLRNDKCVKLYTITHEDMKKLLEKRSGWKIELVPIHKEKRICYLKWKLLSFRTMGKLNLPRPKNYYKYEIRLKKPS